MVYDNSGKFKEALNFDGSKNSYLTEFYKEMEIASLSLITNNNIANDSSDEIEETDNINPLMGSGAIAASGSPGLPPDDDKDKSKTNNSSQSSKGDSKFQDKVDKSWDKGSFDSPKGSLDYHFDKHGKEVGATTPQQYLEKARAFADNLKGAKKVNIKGSTENVVRYYKNGKYIDMVSKKIISFGKQ